ncbi:MAG: hypothetical protein V7K18_20755 [Nostoc sp.]|uniref:hypothetical protein n=1 Tax=Nostoc sp. TaxID=1180 RepID=UPI002FF6CB80
MLFVQRPNRIGSCYILAAQDLGMEVIAATDGKTTEEEKAKIKQYLGEDGMVLSDTTPQALLKVLKQTKAIASGGRVRHRTLR